MSSDADIWQGPTVNIPIVNANGNTYEETQIAAAGQTIFNITTFQYTPGTKSIFVWKNGILLRRAVDYTETDLDTITLASGAVVGDKLTFLAWAIAEVDPPATLNGVPQGGTTGQVLVKNSNSDYDDKWAASTTLPVLTDGPRTDIASAANLNLTTIDSVTRNIRITGTTEIDAITCVDGQVWSVSFKDGGLIKYSLTLQTPTGQNILVSAGDSCVFRAFATNQVEVIEYVRANQATPLDKINEFRISPTSAPFGGLPQITSNFIFLVGYTGTKIALFDGTAWQIVDAGSTSVSYALAGLTAGLPYDVFVYNNSGLPAIEIAAWTSSTVRAIGLAFQDQILCKSTDLTRRYVGTFVPSAANAVYEDQQNRMIWNMYNRIKKDGFVQEAAASWNYSVNAYRQANGNVANQFNFVVGYRSESITAQLHSTAANSAAGNELISAIGYDSVGAPAGGSGMFSVIGDVHSPVANYKVGLEAKLMGVPAEGKHYLSWLEAAPAAGVSTWQGGVQSGMTINWNC